MSTTRATLRTRVLANLEGRSDDAMVTAVDAGLDEACEVLSAWEWREMATRSDSYETASDVAYITVTGLGELYRVQVVDGTSSYTVELRTKMAVEDGTPVAEEQAAGKPVACYREGDTIYFTPVPDAVYALRVHYRNILSLATGSLSLDGFDSLVCAYATGYAFLAVRHAPKHAAEWTGKFQQLVALKRQGLGHNGVAEGMDLRCSPSDGAGYYDQTARGIDPLIVRFRGGAS